MENLKVLIEDLKTTFDEIDKSSRPLVPKEEHPFWRELLTIKTTIEFLEKMLKGGKNETYN